MKTAMILAAGRGERLKPLTSFKPKPLFTVQGIPLIEHHLKGLLSAGFERIVINHAYLGAQIRQHIFSLPMDKEIIFTPEPPGGLETGGGIVNALPFLGKENFLVINADIWTDIDFSTLCMHHSFPAHILLVKKPSFMENGDFGFTTDQLVENENREYVFPGVGVYHPSLFNNQPFGRFRLAPLLRDLADKKQLSGEIFSGKWLDIGTKERLSLANNLS
ncbi:nucleotidyltransferase (plasmid) [Legionella adelaidensis]|uniref:Nucleotidyltransferase n=1 Tax=Legionella adelaidensis TaxID=45056 RepID=A0A0W0R1D2_9GAMM|nr:nucleotidyltransferase family protein [Legionella adelaidensis]KTC64895.1 nucleotidyltransferase [Legionella adelaidensis]VEH82934.1 nucleotidyltransferase [Legionella adelaidensis]